ncbi:PQQ-like beta-propeller repeat protein [Bacillus sp. TH17]|uniref:outer membrane protein assembly factor BamB family protein n=1 Tax=Bacillus sp. TH17 TaxID=2796383 RepID=UPI001911DC22|nr:PQQ-binding-like beta-propeller repeat protein [Bacillus sp. TH17]MBK5489005.1 PQQ-like beta-propeller repeat protein [Bacillus sp. TH17]
MKKKFMLMMLLFALMVGVHPNSMTKAETINTQGKQFEQGKYDLEAEAPFGQHWNRNSPYAGTETPNVKWENKLYAKDGYDYSGQYQTGGYQTFGNQPAIGRDGTIYIGNVNGKLYAFNKDGSTKWIKDKLTTMYGSPVIAEDGTIYVPGESLLTALSPDGSIKWQIKINAVETPILGKDGTIYVHNNGRHRLEAYTPDGTLKWGSNEIFSGRNNVLSSMLSQNGTIYTVVTSGETNYLYAHDQNGKELWKKYVWSNGGNTGFTLGLNDEIYINGGSKFYVFDKNGDLIKEWKWHPYNPSYAFSAPAINSKDGTIYVSGADGLYAYNPDYTLKWKYVANSFKGAPIIDKNGVVYITTTNGVGGVYAINPDGTLKWRLPKTYFIIDNFSNSSMTLGKDGTLYVRATGGTNMNDTYHSLIAIGDSYTDNVCTKDSTYMEVLKSLQAKSRNAKLTDEEKKEAHDILKKLSDDLDKTDK